MKKVFSARRLVMGMMILFALALTACSQSEAPDCGGLKVKQPWVRVAPAGANVMAAYFTLVNDGNSTVIVNGATSSQFDRAEMHETIVSDNGQARMQPLDKVAVDAGGHIDFKPGGRHVMLFGPGQTYKVGDQVEVILSCGSQQAELPVAAMVRRAEPGETARESGTQSGSEDSPSDDDSTPAPDANDSNTP